MVAIAEAFMGDARIVFLDGINDGLTDFQATAVFKFLQKMTKMDSSRTIISTTTHVVSASYFYLD
jgi:ABC-type multidrug transport system ATPase subunit